MGKGIRNDKREEDFVSSIKILRHSTESFKNGLQEAYRPASVELRKLLCDREPLLSIARPEFKLHKLYSTQRSENEPPEMLDRASFFMPGKIVIKTNSYVFTLNFANPLTLLSPKDWVKQPFFTKEITIWKLIKTVADKEGAHSDIRNDDTLSLLGGMKMYDDKFHMAGIITISDYLIQWIDHSKLIK